MYKNNKQYFFLGLSVLIFGISACTRPVNYRENLIDAIQKKDTRQNTQIGSNKSNSIPEKGINDRKTGTDTIGTDPQKSKVSLTQIPQRIRILLYSNKKFPYIHFTEKFVVFNRSDDLIYKNNRGHLSYNLHYDLPFAQFFTKGDIVLGKNHYQGRLFLVKIDKKWQIYLENDIEEYIKGVIPYEMSADWPIEALKAQAIAARTYAVYHILQNPNSPYHVDTSTNYQVYRGTTGQTKRTNQAVAETKGELILFNKLPIPAFFHSHSGGTTEQGTNVWPAGKFNFTQVRNDVYGIKSPVKKWEFSLDALSFMEFLQKEYNLNQVQSFFVVKRTSSNRVKSFRLIGTQDGKKISQEIDANKFRIAFGAAKIKSLLLTMEQKTENGKMLIRFSGKGYGHGVGMSQWGAKEMADMGRNAKEILNYYYKDIAITTLPTTDAIAFR